MKSSKLTLAIALTLFVLSLQVMLAAKDNAAQEHGTKHHRYKVVDLGTFGGPGSTVAGFTHTLTAGGIVVGGADTPDVNPYPGCFNFFEGPDCSVEHAFQWRHDALTDLGTLPGGVNSFPYGINRNGWVIGGSENGTLDPVLGIPEFDAVLWRNGQITNLGTLGGNESLAADVNDHGKLSDLRKTLCPIRFPWWDWEPRPGPFFGSTASYATWTRWVVRMAWRT